MPNKQTISLWGAQAGFVTTVRRWSWFREAIPPLVEQSARDAKVDHPPPVDMPALARAFWAWAAMLDNNAQHEQLDPVDYAHFEVGMLVSLMIAQRPLRLPDAQRSEEVRALTETGLTMLAAWRGSLGAEPLADDLWQYAAAHWSSYVENVIEDPAVAVAFLDQFTGREPVWQFPTLPAERPPLRRALQELRGAA